MLKLSFATFVYCCLLACAALAQTTATLPDKFALPDNPMALSRTARPNTYFDALGRKAGLLGTESGTFEAWVFPLKLFHDARLSVSVEGQDNPIDFASIVHRVIARPAAEPYAAPSVGATLLCDVGAGRPLPSDATTRAHLMFRSCVVNGPQGRGYSGARPGRSARGLAASP